VARGRFDLLTSAEQLDELMRVTRYPKIRERLALPSPAASSMKSGISPSC